MFVLQDSKIWLDSNSANYLLPNSQLKTAMFASSPHSVSHEAEVNLLPVSQDSNDTEATMSKTVSPSRAKHLHIKNFLEINLNQFYNCYQRPNSGDLNRPGSARCVFQGPNIRERWAVVKQKDNFSVPSVETTLQVLTIASNYRRETKTNIQRVVCLEISLRLVLISELFLWVLLASENHRNCDWLTSSQQLIGCRVHHS